MKINKRVAITGLGACSSIGIGVKSFYKSLKSGISKFERIDYGEKSFPFARIEDSKHNSYFFRELASIAFEEAIKQASIDVKKDRIGIVVGCLTCTYSPILDMFEQLNSKTNYFDESEKNAIIQYSYSSVTDYISEKYGITGERVTLTNACATGINVIQRAKEMIESGDYDICIALSVDTQNTLSFLPLYVLKILAEDEIKPFDLRRKGTVLGDGAGALVLESIDHAKKRGIPILSEIRGICIMNDVDESFFTSSVEGNTIHNTMKNAIKLSGLTNSEIGYINAHGTGTKQNDLTESRAIKNLFGDKAYHIPTNSTKSFIGHTGAASGILEVIAGMTSITENWIHPTLGYAEKDPECDLFYVPNQAIDCNINHFLSNSIGFGGINASIVISKYSED